MTMVTAPRTVLVVDDNPRVRATTARLLETSGLGALEASSGEEALALALRGEGVDVMLLDYTMPGMNGIDTLAALRARGSALPVILTSGYTPGDLEDTLQDPRVRFLPKPYRAEALLELIDAMVPSA